MADRWGLGGLGAQADRWGLGVHTVPCGGLVVPDIGMYAPGQAQFYQKTAHPYFALLQVWSVEVGCDLQCIQG